MKSLVTNAVEKTATARPTSGWLAVFGRAKPGSTRDVDCRLAELRRVDPKDWE